MYLVCMNGRTKRMEVRTEKQTDRGTDVQTFEADNVPCGILHRKLFDDLEKVFLGLKSGFGKKDGRKEACTKRYQVDGVCAKLDTLNENGLKDGSLLLALRRLYRSMEPRNTHHDGSLHRQRFCVNDGFESDETSPRCQQQHMASIGA
jgi:hypothetical protein